MPGFIERQGIMVEVNDTWYPVAQVMERLVAEGVVEIEFIDLDEIAGAGILMSLGFRTNLDQPNTSNN